MACLHIFYNSMVLGLVLINIRNETGFLQTLFISDTASLPFFIELN